MQDAGSIEDETAVDVLTLEDEMVISGPEVLERDSVDDDEMGGLVPARRNWAI